MDNKHTGISDPTFHTFTGIPAGEIPTRLAEPFDDPRAYKGVPGGADLDRYQYRPYARAHHPGFRPKRPRLELPVQQGRR